MPTTAKENLNAESPFLLMLDTVMRLQSTFVATLPQAFYPVLLINRTGQTALYIHPLYGRLGSGRRGRCVRSACSTSGRHSGRLKY